MTEPGFVRFSPARRYRAASSRAAVLATGLMLVACGNGTVGPGPSGTPNVDLALPWATATVSEVGGSPEMVARGLERARDNHRMLSLLVVKDGRLVVEQYFGTAVPADLHDVRSVTKSVVSALTGIAIERGDIGGVDDPISDYLDPLVMELEPEKGAITVGHLLTMTSGLDWDESDGLGDYSEWIRSDDHLGFLLDKPFDAPPGSKFTYNSAAVHLLGVVVEQATSMQLPDLAQQVLFSPMGISMSRWEPLRGGFHNGGAGLDLRPRDLARLGQLYLQRGTSGERRIIPAEWVDRSSLERFSWRFDSGSLRGISYGFLWWVVPDAPEPFYYAWGYGGQYVVVVPGLDLVVVTTNDWRGVIGDGGAGRYEQQTMNIVVDHILPAFR